MGTCNVLQGTGQVRKKMQRHINQSQRPRDQAKVLQGEANGKGKGQGKPNTKGQGKVLQEKEKGKGKGEGQGQGQGEGPGEVKYQIQKRGTWSTAIFGAKDSAHVPNKGGALGMPSLRLSSLPGHMYSGCVYDNQITHVVKCCTLPCL